MIKLEHLVVPSKEQWEFAIEGMRNPLNSWSKSDSDFVLGKNDIKLMKKLIKSGTDHRKFLRQLPVGIRITAPLYWWKEFDTYKVGTTSNSCSTIHKIADKKFTLDDFSLECATDISGEYPNQTVAQNIVNLCENYRKEFLRTNDKRVWKSLIQLLPSSYNQTRNVTLNYEVLYNMYFARKNHKLDEWQEFCNYVYVNVPYFKEFVE